MIPIVVILIFVFAPEWLMNLFRPHDPLQTDYLPIIQIGLVLLRFVAVYSIFDILFVVYSSAIKGAGDTRFVMWTIGILSMGIMVLPVYVVVVFTDLTAATFTADGGEVRIGGPRSATT